MHIAPRRTPVVRARVVVCLRAAVSISCLAVLCGAPRLSAEPPLITAFHGNGLLIWTNQPGLHAFGVQWAAEPSGPWSNNWDSLDAIVTSNTATTVAVPMFYRVSQAFTPAVMRGAWMINAPGQGDVHFIAQEDGIVSESAMFVDRAPSGYFTVGTTGNVHFTFVTGDETVDLDGCFTSAGRMEMSAPYADACIRRVEDVSRCMGVWTGALHEIHMVAIITRPLTLAVDARGLVTNATGFGKHNIGRLFSLLDGTTSGFLYTQGIDVDDPDPYDMFRINGTHAGDTISGIYEADDPTVTGSVHLVRQ